MLNLKGDEMKMKAIIYDGKKLIEKEWENDSYDFLRESVEGYIERIPLRDLDERNIDMWCNEEGKFRDLETTILLNYDGKIYDNVVGNVVFTKNKDGETIGLTDDDIKYIKNKFMDDGYYIDLKNNKMIQVLDF